MTPDIALIFSILAVAVLFLVKEWIPMEVTAPSAKRAVTSIDRPGQPGGSPFRIQ